MEFLIYKDQRSTIYHKLVVKILLKFRDLYQILLLSFTLILSSCIAVGPDFVKPEVAEEENWIDIDDPRVKSERVNLSDWWTVFDDPILNTLIQKAFEQNLTIRIAGLRILEARAQLGIAVGQQFPQLQQARAGLSFTEISENTANSFPPIERTFWSYQLGFDAIWELDFWGRFRRAIESADANMVSMIANYDDVLVTLLADVASTYVQIRTIEEQLRIARQNIVIQKRSLNIADVRFRFGMVTELDVKQALTLLRNTQATVPVLKKSLRQAQNRLSILLGEPPGNIENILVQPGPIPTAPLQIGVGIPAQLLVRRPDVRRALFETAAQSARIGIAKSDLFPRVVLFGSIGLASSDSFSSAKAFSSMPPGRSNFGDLFDWGSLTGFFSPTIMFPIFNYGRIRNTVRVQDARFQELVVAYQNTVLRAYQEVEDSLVGFLSAHEQVEFLDESVDAAKRSVDLSLLQYKEGTVDYIRVLNAQQQLLLQQDLLAQSKGSIAINLIGTYKSLGGGWEISEGKDFVPESIKDEMRARTNWGGLLSPEAHGAEGKVKPLILNQPIFNRSKSESEATTYENNESN
ncbi:MAG: efflux transporter outer membrane subunit [Candidatus Dadabacteria bacterium]|nr:MAG: efflux transporter outer membrane subunit [Candidatus Dadabacteria bacterium]